MAREIEKPYIVLRENSKSEMWYKNKLFLSLAGLVTGISLRYNNCPPIILGIVLLSFLLLILDNKRTWVFTVFLLTGTVAAHLHVRIPEKDITKIIFKEPVREAEGKILSAKPDTFSTSYVIRIDSLLPADGDRLKTSGKILLKTNRGQHSAFSPGTYLTIKSLTLRKIPPPKNPYAFDYRGFMQRRGVYMEGTAEELLARPCKRYALSPFLHKTRKMLTGRIENSFAYFPEEKELVETITLGKEKIPDFLRESGTRSGTYHLLVISGLHIAFILLFLKILFIPFAGINNSHPKCFPFFSLLFMWFYAGLTGFRTPVVRAVLMLSFFNAGEILERDIDGIDSIMTAAILMLIINPYNFFDASFQLSFIATAGIILFCRRFNLLNKNFLRGLLLSSFAAQIAVFPLLVYHFGVFYPAGLINNVVFLPFTGILLIVSLLFFLLPFLFEPLRYLLTGFLRGITVSPQFAPFAINFSVSLWFLLMFYGACFLVFYAPRKKAATVFLSAATSFFLLFSIALPYVRTQYPDRFYFLSFSRPSVLFVTEKSQSSVAFLADHYKRPEIEKTLTPLLQKERIKKTAGLFYTNVSYNHTGTLKALQKRAEVRRVYEHPDVRDAFGFPYNNVCFYQSFPGLFEFLSENGEISVNGLTVEVLGAEKDMLSYVVNKGSVSILLAPYLGETLSEKIRDRRFTVACVYDIKTTAKTRKNLDTIHYLYLILPRDYKKFRNLKSPVLETFYLNGGAVKMDFAQPPFHVSPFYE